MNAQQQSKAAEATNRSFAQEQAAAFQTFQAGLTELWPEKLKTWTTAMSVFGKMPLEAYTSFVSDMQDAAKSASEQVRENMDVLNEGLQEISKCANPEAYFKAGAALQQKLAQQGAATGQRMMAVTGNFASRRMKANAALASAVIDKAKSRA